MKNFQLRPQRTIAHPVSINGPGFLTGADVKLQFVPAPAYTGMVFVRTDLPGRPQVPARLDNVTGTRRRTTLGTAPRCVGLVEHVLAALAGLRLDNCFIEVNAPEPPGLDGSAQGFVNLLRQAGTQTQDAPRELWTVDRPVIVQQSDASLGLHPHPEPELRASFFLDYGLHSSIGWQTHSLSVAPQSFGNELASCRTFILAEEVRELKKQGLGKRTQVSDLLVFGPSGPINNRLRFANEPARHKILDIVGDLSLLGLDLHGHLVAYRSGHPLNIALARALAEQIAASKGLKRKIA